MQDLCRTDPTQETRATAVNHADCTSSTRPDELDHARSGADDLSILIHIDHEPGTNDLWMVCARCEHLAVERGLRVAHAASVKFCVPSLFASCNFQMW